MFMSTIFLSLFSRPQENTNPIILVDARQWALTLLLFLLFETCVFDDHNMILFVVW